MNKGKTIKANEKPRVSDKSRLIKKFLERRKWKDYKIALGKKDRGRGIYVLYSNNKIYYIGLSKSSLRSRLKKHTTKDRHKGKWNYFSFYQISRTKYIKDIESLLLRVIHPPGNWVKGRFKKKYDLNKKHKEVK